MDLVRVATTVDVAPKEKELFPYGAPIALLTMYSRHKTCGEAQSNRERRNLNPRISSYIVKLHRVESSSVRIVSSWSHSSCHNHQAKGSQSTASRSTKLSRSSNFVEVPRSVEDVGVRDPAKLVLSSGYQGVGGVQGDGAEVSPGNRHLGPFCPSLVLNAVDVGGVVTEDQHVTIGQRNGLRSKMLWLRQRQRLNQFVPGAKSFIEREAVGHVVLGRVAHGHLAFDQSSSCTLPIQEVRQVVDSQVASLAPKRKRYHCWLGRTLPWSKKEPLVLTKHHPIKEKKSFECKDSHCWTPPPRGREITAG